MLAAGAPFVSPEQLKMMCGGVAGDHAGAGAAAPCEPWQAVATVDGGSRNVRRARIEAHRSKEDVDSSEGSW